MEEKKSIWVDEAGNTFGPFSVQKDGFPNAGKVMEFYREKKNMTRPQLARKLGVTARRVQIMEHDNQVFESISRRRALAAMLGIPPVLLGLASSSAIRPLEEPK